MTRHLVPLLVLLGGALSLRGERGTEPQYAPPDAYLPGEKLPYFGSENPWNRRAFDDPKRVGQREMLAIAEGRVDEAVQTCRDCLAKDPGDLESRFNLAVAYGVQGRIEDGVREFKEAVVRGLPVTRLLAGPRPLMEPFLVTDWWRKEVAGTTHELVHGPLLGAVSPTSARVWVRTEHAALVEVRVSSTDDYEHPDARGSARSDPGSDFTAVVSIDGLAPSTNYTYQVLIDGKPVPRWTEWEFHTFPPTDSRGPVRIAFGGCAMYTRWNECMWDTIRTRRPDAFLILGDNVYIDLPSDVGPMQNYTYYCRQSRPEFRRLIASTPMYAIWDDHDAGMDDIFLGPYSDKPSWKVQYYQLFRRNWNNPSYGDEPKTPGLWFNFRVGAVEIFMLDGRYYRENWLKPGASMLGPVQKAWLRRALVSSTATFKILVSSTPWADDAKLETNPADGSSIEAADDWHGFQAERTEIFDLLAEHHVDGVFLISGDRHRADLRLDTRPHGYPLYELECSRLTNANATKPSGKTLWLYEGNSFALLSFDPSAADPTLRMEVNTIRGEPVLDRTLHLSDMTDK